ncbi:TolC family protein [Sulfurimonas marina]|uniref:TolC family protein n=1 Tax=Sulfurimonas marina TaxID=2590551 RepID=A0A7M1AVM2_9BACT|nr:TolC family protein [Sulfurimonas marina]QOP41487.1 TolC family protein [Sulfurimonas marina]
MRYVLLLVVIQLSLSALTLEEAIEELKSNNLNIQIAQQNTSASQSKLSKKRSSYFGSVDLLASFAKYSEGRTLEPITPPITSSIATSDAITSVGVAYKVNLFNGMRTLNETEMEKLSVSIAKAKENFTQNEQIYITQSIYLNILSLQKILSSQNEYKKALQHLKVIVNESVVYGKKPQLDILKIESQIHNIEDQITLLQTKINISKSKLSLIIYGSFKPINTLEEVELSVMEPSYTLENLPSIKMTHYKLEKTNKAYKNTYSSYYPQINFQASYIDNYGDGNKENVSSAAVNLQWKIFDFGAREDGVELARIEKIKSTIESKQSILEYENRIYEAKEKVLQNQQLVRSSKSQTLVATKIREIEALKYNEGQSSINDLLFASADETLSQSKFIEAKYKLLESQFYLAFLTKE